MKSLWQDIKFAVRSLRRNPGFTSGAALTLALAIGANTAVFTVVNGVLLRPLPFGDADRLMVVSYWPTYAKGHLGAPAMLGRDYLTLRQSNRSFDRVAMIIPYGAKLTGSGDAATIPGALVSTDFFSVLGIKPATGRTFAPDEGTSTGAGVVVISNKLWRERFASDSSIVGRSIRLEGKPQTVIGVMPEGFDFPKLPAQAPVRGITPFPASEYWLAISVDPGYAYYEGPVIGRLRPGVTAQKARAELQAMAKASFVAVVRQRPQGLPSESYKTTTAQVLPLRDIYLNPPSLRPEESRDARTPLLLFGAAVVLVLAIACSNVAGLILMRTMSRTHELEIRAALGASRWRLVQHSLIESLCISLTGAIAGVPLAWAGVRVLLSLAPPGAIPLADQVRVDGPVLALSVAMVLVCGVFAGLAPAIFASRQSPQATLGRGNRVSERHPVLEATTAASMAFALILLTGAGLLVQSFLRLQAIRLGFEPRGVVTMRIVSPGEVRLVPGEMDRARATMRAFRDRVFAELARLPQTASVAASSRYLVGASPGHVGSVTVDGRGNTEPGVIWSGVSPDYFDVLRIPLVAGRTFTRDDDDRSAAVAIVSRSFADNVWPGQSALGKRVWISVLAFPPKNNPDANDWVTVVGVVGDAIQGSIRKSPPGIVYSPLNQMKGILLPENLEFSVRTAGDPVTAMQAIRRAMHTLAPNVSIEVLSPLSSLVETERLQPLFQARLIATFSLLALVLAAVGTYSTLAYSVAQRRHELAIRLALGAQPASVVRLVVRRGALLALLGIVAGLVGSLALTRALQSVLYQTSVTDPRVFAAAATLLVIFALLACIVPTRRATLVDPIVELRKI
jgi:putative ABC transport system permease protein